MELRLGYKQTELGVIPEEWGVGRLGSICDVRDGTHESPRFVKQGVPFVTSKNIVDGHLDLENVSYITEQDAVEFDKRSKVDKNDILMSMIGTIGSAVLVKSEPHFCIKNVALIKARRIDPSFLIQLINSLLYQRYLGDNLDGGIQKFISLGTLRQLVVPEPDSKEQRAIATALTDVDALLAKLDQFIAKKRNLKLAAMQQLLTGQTRLPGFSGAWEEKPIASFSAFVTKGSTPTTYGFNWEDDGVLFLRSECVSAAGLDLTQSMFISEAAHAALLRGEVRAGDILMTITGNVGRVVRLNADFGVANINQHIARIRVKDPYVSSIFVFHWLSQENVRANYALITTGQAYPQISLKQVRETLVPLPSFPEQTAIATVLSDMDAELSALETRRDKTRALKQGMMQELLTGRIRLV